eukprot:GHVU01051991.1.p2 GENE.GHVU01051991.1~~GHVU01051991.1.p2  ORF type:complete len:101 (+),score=7.80 GHVU01051991.1:460-762(+)
MVLVDRRTHIYSPKVSSSSSCFVSSPFPSSSSGPFISSLFFWFVFPIVPLGAQSVLPVAKGEKHIAKRTRTYVCKDASHPNVATDARTHTRIHSRRQACA